MSERFGKLGVGVWASYLALAGCSSVPEAPTTDSDTGTTSMITTVVVTENQPTTGSTTDGTIRFDVGDGRGTESGSGTVP